jgi:hypothetical protein
MAATAKGFPYPVSGDGRPHIDQAIEALAARVEAVLSILSDAELALLAGVDLWDGRLAMQSNAGSVRKWRGLYEYRTSPAGWKPLVPVGALATFTPAITRATTNPTLGTGPTQAGRYSQLGGLIIGRGSIQYGSGSTAGTGTVFLSLPVAAATAQLPVIGRATYFGGIVGTPNTTVAALELVTSTTAKMPGGSSPGSAGGDADALSYNAAVPPLFTYTFRYKAA